MGLPAYLKITLTCVYNIISASELKTLRRLGEAINGEKMSRENCNCKGTTYAVQTLQHCFSNIL